MLRAIRLAGEFYRRMKNGSDFLDRLDAQGSRFGNVVTQLHELPEADQLDFLKYAITNQNQKSLSEILKTIAERLDGESPRPRSRPKPNRSN
jgi:hypothetical protein